MTTKPAAARAAETGTNFDAVVVGAGFAGMYMLHRLRGLGFSVQVFEAGGGVGGTWYWNRYPGARCDVESMKYSFSFSEELDQEWSWSEKYSPQPEILAYANHIADRFELRRDIAFNTRVTKATFDESAKRWTVETDRGDKVTAQFCIMAVGCLSSPNRPRFEGIDDFKGPIYHTGEWPHEGVDFTGLRVGVIGTGSSAIQSIPIIARQASHLTVFQRTANYTIPAHNRPLDSEYVREVKATYPEMRKRAKSPADFVRGKIREIVKDPKTAELLSPKNIIGCKRLCVDTGYWETFNRPNVTLVDVSDPPIERITADGLVVNGKSYKFDCLVLATGFD